MEDIALALRSHMIIQDAIAGVFGDRVHIDDLPQNADYPCIRIQVVSDYPIPTQSSMGLGRALLQLNVTALSRVDAGRDAEIVRAVYEGYRGAMGEFTVRVFARNITSDWIENAKVYIRMVEVDIGYVR